VKSWLQKINRKRVCIPLAIIFGFLVYTIVINRYSLVEGVGYLLDGITYKPVASNPVRQDGPFGIIHKLVSLSSQERMEAIKSTLLGEGVRLNAIPVIDGYENIFVPGDVSNGFILVEAHYDKKMDDPAFQAATDNTGSVAVLLSAIRYLKEELPKRPVGFLFTPLEERGLIGAHRFIEYARQNEYRIKGVLCLDMVGRGKPVLATPANSAGFRFYVPFYGPILFDGRHLCKGPTSWGIDKSMVDTYLSKIDTYRAFLSHTNANAFIDAGTPAVHLEGNNMWHADQVWGRYTDTIDRLDEQDLLQCKKLVENLVKKLK